MATARTHPGRGFTFLELIVVMMLLATVLAISAPRLAGFMAGRNAGEECRRLVALTQHARSESISRGQRMELWLRPETGEYGLRVEGTAESGDPRAIAFTCADTMDIEVDDLYLGETGEAVIIFWPDGTIDEQSPEQFLLLERGEPAYVFEIDEYRTAYTARRWSDADAW